MTNLSVVSLMVLLLRGPQHSGVAGAIARDLARNPLLIAVVAGTAVNLAGVPYIPVV
ncbi:MAG: hypothetical protein VCB77_02550 [Alphaproteobacteria bacterium]